MNGGKCAGSAALPNSRTTFRVSIRRSRIFAAALRIVCCQSTKTAEPRRPYSAPTESSLLWLRTITNGIRNRRANCKMKRMRVELVAKHDETKNKRKRKERKRRTTASKADHGN